MTPADRNTLLLRPSYRLLCSLRRARPVCGKAKRDLGFFRVAAPLILDAPELWAQRQGFCKPSAAVAVASLAPWLKGAGLLSVGRRIHPSSTKVYFQQSPRKLEKSGIRRWWNLAEGTGKQPEGLPVGNDGVSRTIHTKTMNGKEVVMILIYVA